jgi:hypothetical protein
MYIAFPFIKTSLPQFTKTNFITGSISGCNTPIYSIGPTIRRKTSNSTFRFINIFTVGDGWRNSHRPRRQPPTCIGLLPPVAAVTVPVLLSAEILKKVTL